LGRRGVSAGSKDMGADVSRALGGERRFLKAKGSLMRYKIELSMS
jgi:hypothetical protein